MSHCNEEAGCIEFLFEPAKSYSIGQLKAEAAKILGARQRDKRLSGMMRAPVRGELPWAKSWNEELHPLKILADHMKLSDDATFRWTPDGAFDFEVGVAGKTIKIQSTTAYPEWSVGSDGRGAGYIHSREMKQYNEHGFSYGGGLVSKARAKGYEEDLRAWRAGIKTALTSKLQMRCEGCRLLIFAGKCQFDNIDFDFAEVVIPAIDEVDRAVWGRTFEGIYVVDSPASAFVEVSRDVWRPPATAVRSRPL
jgi:hypothetical protein